MAHRSVRAAPVLRLLTASLVLPARLAAECAAEAAARSPLETGGVFLGIVGPSGRRLVQHLVGPGPTARRGRRWLEVDHDWQNAEIARLHAAHPDLGYLGEWHSHPEADDARPSRTDRMTLAALAAYGALRCPDPIMVILHPKGGGWAAAGWRRSDTSRVDARAPEVEPVEIEIAT